MQDLKI